jgi:hypothetical protein
MKYARTTGFLIDLRRLPEEHRNLFVRARNRAPPDIAWPSRFGRITDSAVLVAVA